MFGRRRPEVLVVGAGPVGMLAALVLAKRGVRVGVVDRDWRSGAHSYALALHGRSLAILDEVGLGDAVRQGTLGVEDIGLYDGKERKAEIALPAEPNAPGALTVMRQDVLERVLEDALARAGVDVLWNHEVVRLDAGEHGVTATIDRLQKDSVGYAAAHTEWVVTGTADVEVPMVIGADGCRSSVRRSLGIDFPEVGPSEQFAVFEFRSAPPPGREMRVVLGDRTTDVLWPQPGGLCRWSFQLLDAALPETTRTKDRVAVQLGRGQFPVLGEDSLRSLLAQRAPWFDARVEEVVWRIAVRFERRLAPEFGRGRVWLAGDAGHVTGPVGMQSMNVGLREARELATIAADVLREGASLDRLAAYGRERSAEWSRLLGQQGGLEPGDATDPWIAQHCGRLLPCLPASGEELAALAGQLGLRVV